MHPEAVDSRVGGQIIAVPAQPRLDQAWLLFSFALALRAAYLVLALNQVGLDGIANFASDTQTYLRVADHFLTGHPDGERMMLIAGPGYGLILAGIRAVLGDYALWPILLSILAGALTPVLVYLLALRLVASEKVAVAAGLITALSLTSVALSSQILTDQLYFTLQLAALYCFVSGLRTAKISWFLSAGVVGAAATLVRSTGEFWPYLFLLMGLLAPFQPAFKSRWQVYRRVLVTVLIMLLVTTGWSLRNLQEHDVYTFSVNGMLTVRSYLLNEAVCAHTPGCISRDQGMRWAIEDGDRTERATAWYPRVKDRVRNTTLAHPGWVLETYLKFVDLNIRAPNNFLYFQLPQFQTITRVINRQVEIWLGYLIFLVSVAGIGWLVLTGNRFAAIVLGVTFLYFTLITGFTFEQGSRLHYPAEMAWSILVASIFVKLTGPAKSPRTKPVA